MADNFMTSFTRLAMKGYTPSDLDDMGAIQYFGFINDLGAWYIMKYDTGAAPKTIRWARGGDGYAAAFTGRALLTYDYFNVVFA
jgi:hypothetical protein